jgi:hypothetical protein
MGFNGLHYKHLYSYQLEQSGLKLIHKNWLGWQDSNPSALMKTALFYPESIRKNLTRAFLHSGCASEALPV